MSSRYSADVAVIGAGVFGAWTAYQLRQSGHDVLLVDAYGAGNSRSSSGGESRILRMGYGPDAIYTRMAHESSRLWADVFAECGKSHLFQSTGVLWLAREHDAYCEATLKTFEESGISFERVSRDELDARYAQFDFGPISWGILELESGVLLARQAIQALVREMQSAGLNYLTSVVEPINAVGPRLTSLTAANGETITADKFVFACGPWLPKLFPALLGRLIKVTRQEVFFLGTPAGNEQFRRPHLPAWIDFTDLVYGIPDLENRGFKIAIDEHGPTFDPDSGERIVAAETVSRLRAYLQQRLPLLGDAPILESRVCQYENTSNGDFLIDRHPDLENVWLVGGGSGHGFKHGPAVGALAASLVADNGHIDARFSFATKHAVHNREVY